MCQWCEINLKRKFAYSLSDDTDFSFFLFSYCPDSISEDSERVYRYRQRMKLRHKSQINEAEEKEWVGTNIPKINFHLSEIPERVHDVK